MGTSPAQRIARLSVQVGVAHPRRATPTKVGGAESRCRGRRAIAFAPAPVSLYVRHAHHHYIEDRSRRHPPYLAKAFKGGRTCRRPGRRDGVAGYDLALEGAYDVAIVDHMLPKMDSLTLVGALREQKNETPVLILSALGQVDDRVKGCAPAAATICRSLMPSPSFWRGLKRWRAAGGGGREETVLRVADLMLDRLSQMMRRSDESYLRRANSGCSNFLVEQRERW